jgi:molybdopterin synthase catalytic subunit
MNSRKDKKHTVLMQGPISPQFIADSIAKHNSKTDIGAHSIFLGQVRRDLIGDKTVAAIDYSAYAEMAEKEFHRIRENAFERYALTCMHLYHSIGEVRAGEISLFVFVSSVHRKEAFVACQEIVDDIKANVPICGKEIMEDGSFVWKENRKEDPAP